MISDTQVLEYLYNSTRDKDENKLDDNKEEDKEKTNDEGNYLITG